jgi:hypothetical protein
MKHLPTMTIDFAAIFQQLVKRFQPRTLSPGTGDAYASTLARFPIDVLQASADQLAQTQKYFPTVQEWTRAAQGVQQRDRVPVCGVCRCGGLGLVRVAYRSGEPFDVAICHCDAAKPYRRGGPELVRLRFGLDATHDVLPIEAFEDEAPA